MALKCDKWTHLDKVPLFDLHNEIPVACCLCDGKYDGGEEREGDIPLNQEGKFIILWRIYSEKFDQISIYPQFFPPKQLDLILIVWEEEDEERVLIYLTRKEDYFRVLSAVITFRCSTSTIPVLIPTFIFLLQLLADDNNNKNIFFRPDTVSSTFHVIDNSIILQIYSTSKNSSSNGNASSSMKLKTILIVSFIAHYMESEAVIRLALTSFWRSPTHSPRNIHPPSSIAIPSTATSSGCIEWLPVNPISK